MALCEFKSYTYYLRGVSLGKLPDHFTIIQITSENLDILVDFLRGLTTITHAKVFDFYAIPDIGNITTMIQSRDLYIYCLKRDDHVYGIYFLKDIHTNYENIENGNTLQCIASINNSSSVSLFAQGFMYAIRSIVKKKIKQYQVLIIDHNSHNGSILNGGWNAKFSHIFENKCAYYLYNYVYPPLDHNKCMFVL